MNLQNSAYDCLNQIFIENGGLKVILTDSSTLTVISLAMTRTELLKNEVINTEIISDLVQKPVNPVTKTLKCICLLKPTQENLSFLQTELSQTHHFANYYIYFTNLSSDELIRSLAHADFYSLVSSVCDIFLDHFPITSRLFSLGVPSISDLRFGRPSHVLERLISGIYSSICSLQLSPLIRYDSLSGPCSSVAQALASRISDHPFGPIDEDSLLLILDRSFDPLIALTMPFFYLSAAHEFFTIKDNLIQVPGASRPFVFNERHDYFLQTKGTSFLSEAGPEIAQLMQEASHLSQVARQKVTSTDQIPTVIHAVSQFQEKIASATAHAAIMEAITNRVNERDLLNAGELEQSIVTQSDAKYHCDTILNYYQTNIQSIQNQSIQNQNDLNAKKEETLKLCMLFALRYNGKEQKQIDRLIAEIPEAKQAIQSVLAAFETERRGNSLFEDENSSTISKILQFTRLSKIGDANANVLSLYKCGLRKILDQLKKGNLGAEFPYAGVRRADNLKPKRVIVFFVGGATYEEFRVAKELSKPDFEIIIGGNTIHNTSSYVKYEIEPFGQI